MQNVITPTFVHNLPIYIYKILFYYLLTINNKSLIFYIKSYLRYLKSKNLNYKKLDNVMYFFNVE